jgi:hypothetical protein
MNQYNFASGQMPPDAEGHRPQALIIIDSETGRKIAVLPYDEAANVLLAAMALAQAGTIDRAK